MDDPYEMFPDFSDMPVDDQTRSGWENEWAIRRKYASYYDGTVLNQVTLDEDGNEIEEFPVGLNLAKMLCLAQADTLFGEWDEDIVSFEPFQDTDVTASEEGAVELAQTILRESSINTNLWEIGLDSQIFGGGAMRLRPWSKGGEGGVKWSRVPLDHFWPIWDPEDIDRLLETYIVYSITKDQARAKYGYTSEKDQVKCVEHWTLKNYDFQLDGHTISEYSGYNPWGLIPFEYLPRMRSHTWWGDSLIDDIIRPQDELNARVADLGEAINYNSHPVRWGRNLKRAFDVDSFPIAPNVLWDLGSQISKDTPAPEVGLMEAKNPVPAEAFQYVSFLYDWTRVTSFSPPVVFGEDTGGAQRSGITVELRMWPMLKAVRRTRAYLHAFLRRAMRSTAIILSQKKYTNVSPRALKALPSLTPHFFPIMPRDQAAIVDEIVKSMSTNPPVLSQVTAVKRLGYGTGEVGRIEEMLKSPLYKTLNQPAEKVPGRDSATGAAPDKDEDEQEALAE